MAGPSQLGILPSLGPTRGSGAGPRNRTGFGAGAVVGEGSCAGVVGAALGTAEDTENGEESWVLSGVTGPPGGRPLPTACGSNGAEVGGGGGVVGVAVVGRLAGN